MGVKALPRICAKLIENGKDPSTPAATIQWGTRVNQRTCVSTIKNLPQDVVAQKISSPAITIVGKVVTLRDTMNWFEKRPLFGRTIVVTRTRQQASDLSKQLHELGANVIEAPTIELQPPNSWESADLAIGVPPLPPGEGRGEGARIANAARNVHAPSPQPFHRGISPHDGGRGGNAHATWDWIIFTSANGVRFTRDRLRALGRDVRIFGSAKIAAIGDATADAIRNELALHVDLCPESFVAEALANALQERGQIAGKRFLLLRADIARPILREKLEQGHAAEVKDVAIYETKPAQSLPPNLLDSLENKQVHWITFTSSSTAKNFVSLLGSSYAEKLKDVKIASIGPITTSTLKELGLSPTIEAETFNIEGLVRAIESAK